MTAQGAREVAVARGSAVMVLVFAGALALSTQASAEPPRQTDIDTCSKEAAAAVASSLEEEAAPEINGSTSGPQGATEATAKNVASRQTFAACLARHGYYKGYYR